MNLHKAIATPSVARPCEVCERMRADQCRITKRGTVYIALVCDECRGQVEDCDQLMERGPWARIYRLVPQH